MKNLIILLSILISFPSIGQAQQHEHGAWCGTEISAEWMQAFYLRDKSHLTNKSGNYPEVHIPIVYHLVGDDNGNGYYGLHEVFRSHCDLQALFSDADVTFYIKDIYYINNSSAYQGNNTYSLFQENDPNACNVYVVDDMNGVCGYSFVPEAWDGSGWGGPNRGGIMLQKGCMGVGNTTYRHEMGHYLNLPHTFFGWEGEDAPGIGLNAPTTINGNPVERADQSNCYSSGDGFCDTPPDYLSDRWTCNFARTYIDPAGTSFTVDENNFMSYSNDGCSTYLKDEQLAEVNAAAANHRPYLLNDPVPVVQTLPQMNGLAPDDNTSNYNANEVILSWNRTLNATYYHLQATRFNFTNPTVDIVVTDTFYILDNPFNGSPYEWRVKPVNFTDVCAPFTPIRGFNVSNLSAEIDVTNSSCVENSDGRIEVLMDQTGIYNYYWSCDDPSISANIQNINSNTLDNLSPERYSVTVVRTNGDTMYAEINLAAPNPLEIEINQFGNQLIADVEGGSPPYSFIWNNGAESLALTDISSGEYSIIVIDQNGCQKSGAGFFDEQATGIRDTDTELIGRLLIAPNPAQSGRVKVVVPMQEAGDLNLTLVDLSGKVLRSQSLDAKEGLNTVEMELSNLSKGIYIVHAQSAAAAQSAKLVIR